MIETNYDWDRCSLERAVEHEKKRLVVCLPALCCCVTVCLWPVSVLENKGPSSAFVYLLQVLSAHYQHLHTACYQGAYFLCVCMCECVSKLQLLCVCVCVSLGC